MMKRYQGWLRLSVAFSALSATTAFAAAEVIEARPARAAKVEEQWHQVEETYTQQANRLLDMQGQIDGLHREIQLLRGSLETQAHAMNQLSQQQNTLYSELDEQLAHLSQQFTVFDTKIQAMQVQVEDTVASTPVTSILEATLSANEPAGQEGDEKQRYQVAYEQLQAQDYTTALDAFERCVNQYPEGEYTANAYYWIGEIYLLAGDFQSADHSFEQVIQRFPEHAKASDALLKRGYVEYDQAHWMQAKAYFNEVKARFPGSAAARLAEARIQKMKLSQR